jgi:hypothetical protein
LLAGLMGGLFDYRQSTGLGSAFGSLGLALGVTGAGFLVAALMMKARGAQNAASSAATSEG